MPPPFKTLNSEQRIQIESLAAFLSKDQIADYFGIARNTLTAIMEREPDVAERFARGRNAQQHPAPSP